MADSMQRLLEGIKENEDHDSSVARAYGSASSQRKIFSLGRYQCHLIPCLIGLVAVLFASTIGLALRLPCALYLPHGSSSCRTSVSFDCGGCIPDQQKAVIAGDHSTAKGWAFEPARDDRNYGLTHEQCQAAFPGLFSEIDQAVERRRDLGQNGRLTSKYLDEQDWRVGTFRVMVYDGELFLISQKGEGFGPRLLASFQSLNRALSAAPEFLPNIEFAVNDADWVDPASPYWAYTRKADWNNTWLMPDYGLYSWPQPGIGTYQEVRRRMRDVEHERKTFQEKIQKVFWRGNLHMGEALRKDMLRVSANKPWSDINTLEWSDEDDMAKNYVSIEDHCKYALLLHTEGESYSGRLKYLQNCRSLIFIHRLQWIQPFQYLLVKDGEKQNYVEVERDFSDLDEKVNYYLKHPDEADRIIENSVSTFRDRYITPAATSCYWRRLVRGYAEVSEPPEFYMPDGKWRGVPFESAAIMGKLHWKPH